MSTEIVWDQTMMRLIHGAMRRDLAAFSKTLRAHAEGAAGSCSRAALAERWAFFERTLHHHHTGEDTHLWPLLRGKLPDAVPLLDELEAEHTSLDPLLKCVAAGMATVGSATAEQLTSLADSVDELAEKLSAHLAHEERDAVPLLERHVTPAEAKAFEKQQQRDTGRDDGAMFFPWLTVDAPPAQAAVAWGHLPPPVRWIFKGKWVNGYKASTSAAFAA